MVVYDFKVPHGLALGCPSKVHIQLGLASSLGQHREVSGLSNFHTWETMQRWQRGPGHHYPQTQPHTGPRPCPTLTCAVQSRALSLNLASIMGRVYFDVEGAGRDLLDVQKASSGLYPVDHTPTPG